MTPKSFYQTTHAVQITWISFKNAFLKKFTQQNSPSAHTTQINPTQIILIRNMCKWYSHGLFLHRDQWCRHRVEADTTSEKQGWSWSSLKHTTSWPGIGTSWLDRAFCFYQTNSNCNAASWSYIEHREWPESKGKGEPNWVVTRQALSGPFSIQLSSANHRHWESFTKEICFSVTFGAIFTSQIFPWSNYSLLLKRFWKASGCTILYGLAQHVHEGSGSRQVWFQDMSVDLKSNREF